VVGLKDSSGQFVYFQSVQLAVAQRPDFTLLVGPEEMLAATVLLGSHGGVPGGGNLFPRLYVELWEAATAGDLETTRRLHAQTIRISTSLYCVGNYGTGITKAIKAALACLGVCGTTMAEPFQALDAADQARVRKVLDELASYEPEICAVKLPYFPGDHAPS
jgi:4-hydroxy-tetrahydrodipicolinate synthase